MTEPRRWPKRAERFRLEALTLAMQIGDLAEEVQSAILEEENLIRAMALLGHIALAAREIREMMRDAKRGKE